MSETIPDLPDYCWPVDWACDQAFYDDLTTMPDPEDPDGPRIPDPDGILVAERAEALAAQTLQALTGYRVGGCPVAVRPCSPRCIPGSWLTAPGTPSNWAGYSGWTFSPYIGAGGQWLNACGCVNDGCSCTKVEEVILPGVVGHVVSVEIDGAALSPFSYRVDNGNRLVRTDGGSWPSCQDMNADEGEGTFIVTYQRGAPVDGLGAWASGLLAKQYAMACTGGRCDLPTGVTSIVRSGISMEIATGAFPDGLTGIRDVDSFIQSWNPYTNLGPAEVFSPDVPRGRQTTWRAS